MFRSLVSFVKQNPPKSEAGNGSIEKKPAIFPIVDPTFDGPDCDKDCADCTIKFPSRFKVNSDRELYGSIKPFVKHVLVATGKADWAPKVENEVGSLMEGFKNGSFKPKQGRMMVSASNLSIEPEENNKITEDSQRQEDEVATSVLVLPSFTFVDSVTVSRIPEFMDRFIDSSLPESDAEIPLGQEDPVSPMNRTEVQAQAKGEVEPEFMPEPNGQTSHSNHRYHHHHHHQLTTRPCLRDHLILLCSHNRRDARCGISAPLIRRELERHLRPLGLYRDEDDSRPGGVGIVYVSHVGGHKFAANVLIYRREEEQMIWLARVRPVDCEGIVRQTILKGKVVHPEQLRGGFDEKRGVASW
ncbi:hypothetical protein AJ78_05915 [Emergomyces pasteurianus Ep9510]|uniref:Sucrase/ferredoxin-like family protein n=1 Tax=Emergomyces pasteurianus Ep9510 TaxID=1447872 RepID=A0A1J9PCC4_9EURO|nr:hypothetical protein AJ78_05915 [Emergomyces pasteurianus Ep9510]